MNIRKDNHTSDSITFFSKPAFILEFYFDRVWFLGGQGGCHWVF